MSAKKMTKQTGIVRKGDAKQMQVRQLTKSMSIENIDPGQDITIPRIKLLQPSSDEVTTLKLQAGNFYNKITGDVMKTLDVVPLYLFKRRYYYDKDTNELVCSSQDSITSSQGLYQGRQCIDCEFSKFKVDPKTGKKLRPQCSLYNNFLAYTKDDIKSIKDGKFIFPKVISFKGMSYRCSKDIISTVVFLGKELFSMLFSLEAVPKTKDKFNYFEATIKQFSQISNDTANALANLVPQFRPLVSKIEIEIEKEDYEVKEEV